MLLDEEKQNKTKTTTTTNPKQPKKNTLDMKDLVESNY